MATIYDIAREAGVTKSTVSRVLSNSGPVKKETVQKILAAIEKFDYTPNHFAQAMKTNKSNSIGILIPDYSNPFFADWFQSFEYVSKINNYINFVCVTEKNPEIERRFINELLKRKIDGIIYFSYHKDIQNFQLLKKIDKHTPVVFMDPMMKDEDVSYVFADGHKGTCDAVRYLIDNNRKRIAYIKGPQQFLATDERFQGYKKMITELIGPFDNKLVFEGDFTMLGGYKAAEYFMGMKNPPDAIISATDTMAIGAIKYFNFANIKIPEEVSVVGFDNIQFSKLIEPNLTTVAMPISEMGKEAARIVFNRIENKSQVKEQFIFDCELIIRRSTDITKPNSTFV